MQKEVMLLTGTSLLFAYRIQFILLISSAKLSLAILSIVIQNTELLHKNTVFLLYTTMEQESFLPL